MAYPTDKETWDRVETNDIIIKEHTNNWEIFLEALQETLGYGSASPFPLRKAIFYGSLVPTQFGLRWGWTDNVMTTMAMGERVFSFNGSMRNFYIKPSNTIAVGAEVNFTLYKNGSPTAVTFNFLPADTDIVKKDTTNIISVAIDDKFTWKLEALHGVYPNARFWTSVEIV